MARILCAWELGGDFGHMSKFLPLALLLRERGHEVSFVLRDLSNAESVLGRQGFPLLQAPIWLPKVQGLPKTPLNYTEILLPFGFLHKPGLMGIIKGWRELYRLVKPDMILADHSPTALLASRGLPLKRALFGTGFCSPPRTTPLPNMRPWQKVDVERLATGERNVVQTVNAVLAEFGVPPLKAVADIFDVDEDFLCTFPEVDHYPNRGPARYWNPVFTVEQGQELAWPPGPGKHVFAYVKPQYRDFEKILALLRDLKGAAVVFAPGISKALFQKYQSPKLTITAQPVKLAGILSACDLAICHAGHGTVAAALLAGVPLLLLPTQLEQYLTSLRVVQMGAGLLMKQRPPDEPPAPKGQGIAAAAPKAQGPTPPVPSKAPEPDFRAVLIRLLSKPAFAKQAKAFAARHADFNQAAQCDAMARRIEELAESRPAT